MRTIAFEEHHWTAELAAKSGTQWKAGAPVQQRDDEMCDLAELRLEGMDAAGIDLQVISHTLPAVQHLQPAEAVKLTQQANDRLSGLIRAHPDRFMGFAALPTADPTAAADELERAVTERHLVGALLSSTLGTNGAFLDDARYKPLLDRAERLGVPVYLHPSEPPASLREILDQGLFERHPRLRLILGHCCDTLPFMFARIDDLLRSKRTGLARPLLEYFLGNVWVTTGGLFALPPVLCAIKVFGVDRVLFSVDDTYSASASDRKLLDKLPLSPADRDKIVGGNAARLLGLDR